MEAAELAAFMFSACSFGILLEHPASPIRAALPDPWLRRLLMGLAMGITAIAIIHSPWGKQSGAHFNPSVTLTFLRLGKIDPRDAAFYVLAQFVGGLVGVLAAARFLGNALADPSVRYVVTEPGPSGVAVAFAGEVAISFVMMWVVLSASNRPQLARFTGLFAGLLVATWITLEAPLSGMSMNPARTLASAISAASFEALWIYFLAPLAGMLLAAEAWIARRGRDAVACAKLHHRNPKRCIFCEAEHPAGAS